MICWECVFIKHDICQDHWCQRTLTLQFKMLSTSTILMKCEWHPSVLVYLRNCTISVRARQVLFTIHITSVIVVCYSTVYTGRQPFIYKFRFRLWILFFHFCILWRFYIKLWVYDIKIRKNISPFYAFKGFSKTEHNTLFFHILSEYTTNFTFQNVPLNGMQEQNKLLLVLYMLICQTFPI